MCGTTDIEREVLVLKREEQKLTREIKQAAAKGNTAGAKQLAKSLIRLRAQEAKLQASMGQLRGVKTSITVNLVLHVLSLVIVLCRSVKVAFAGEQSWPGMLACVYISSPFLPNAENYCL